jgi:hypothetical protein
VKVPLFAAGTAAVVVFVAVGVADALVVAVADALAVAVAAVVAFFVATGCELFVVAGDDEADAVVLVPVEPIAAPPAMFKSLELI